MLNEKLENSDLLEVAEICSKKGFFKRVAGGEELGKMFFEKISNISPDSEAIKTVNAIVRWINYGEELGLS